MVTRWVKPLQITNENQINDSNNNINNECKY